MSYSRSKSKTPTPFDQEIREVSRRLRKLANKARSFRISKFQQEQWEDPAYRAKMVAGPERRARISESLRKRFKSDEDERQRRSDRMKAQWQDPEVRAKMRAGISAAHTNTRLNKALGVAAA